MPTAPSTPPLAACFNAWDRLRRPIWVFDPASYRGLYANPPAMALWSADSLDELLSRDFSQLSPAVLTRVDRLAQATAGGGAVSERWSFYPHGKPVTVKALISSIDVGDGATALLFEATVTDVTSEELRAVEALRHTSTLISLFDGAGRATFANPAAFAAYGDAGNDFVARFSDAERGAEALAEVLDGEVLAELRQMRADGDERWRHLDARRVTDPVTGAASVLLSERDVTSQVLAERALAAAHERAEVAEAKQRFLANISHELRTPLNAVIGFAGLLASSDELGTTQRGHVLRIGEAGERLARILNDVIDLAELDGGELRLARVPFDPESLLRAALDEVRAGAAAKDLALRLEVPTPPPGPLLGDPARLTKIVAHFLDNALKFTERGEVTLRLDAEPTDSGADLTIAVADTGPGLDAAAQARLFRRFSQADDSLRRRVDGGGLGLAIVRELAALMGGVVGVESAPGRGARFWVRIAFEAAAGASPAPAADAAEAEDDSAPFSVLYADDSEPNRMLVQAILTSQGVGCDLVCDGAQAVAAVRDGEYDLVLMDIQMPVMDGVAAAREIRRLPAPAGAVPIVALTANTLSDQRDAYAQAGMEDCIAKPVNMAELIAKTAAWGAAGRDQRRELRTQPARA